MSVIINPSSSGGSVNIASLDITLPAKYDQVTGTVTGLSATPSYVISQAIYEEGVTVQSGLQYNFTASNFASHGFSWTLNVLNNEYWPGPGSVTVKINYVWS